MSDDYTPDTDEVRESFYVHAYRRDMEHLRAAAFDRWLTAHDAATRTAAQAQAWDEGHETWWKRGPSGCQCGAWSSGECGCGLYGSGELLSLADNPYRTVTDEETQ